VAPVFTGCGKMLRVFPQGLSPLKSEHFMSELKLRPPREATFSASCLDPHHFFAVVNCRSTSEVSVLAFSWADPEARQLSRRRRELEIAASTQQLRSLRRHRFHYGFSGRAVP